MKKKNIPMQRVFAGILSATLVFASYGAPLGVASAKEDSTELPENIIENKKSFDSIDEVVAGYEAKFPNRTPAASQYITSVNGEKRLKRINFYYPETPTKVDGEYIIDIPEDVAKVMRMFGNVRYTGTIAENGAGKMYIVDPDGSEHELPNYDIAWKGEYKDAKGTELWTSYGGTRTCDSALMSPTDHKNENGEVSYTGYKLKFTGHGDLSFIYLWEEAGLATEYDTSAYGILGGDKGIADVTINVDTTKNLSINGINKMDESAFKRVHVNSGPVQVFYNLSDPILDDEVFSKTYRDWGFTPGRGTFQIKDAGGLLTERKNSPGFSDQKKLNKEYKYNEVMTDKLNTLFPTVGNDYVLTYDGWPEWQWGDLKEMNERNINMASPSEENFLAAGDTAAAVTRAVTKRLGGYGPKYIEIKNESTIPSEWAYFNTESEDAAWKQLASFHNTVSTMIKNQNPDVLVGGPSSAFMYLEKNNFKEAEHQLTFMDRTKNTMDWYSHHFYENSDLYVNGRKDNSDGFLCGRFEAVLDLIRAHMANTDNVKPILITEEGSYNGLTSDIDYFQELTAFNGYFIRSLDYADTIDMLVPYLYPVKSWAPTVNHQLYKYNSTQTDILEEMTPLEAYVDLWKDFRGAYLPTDVTAKDDIVEERVYTSATRAGDMVYVAVHNLNDQRINLDLNAVLGDDVKVDSITEKHYYLEKAKLTYEESEVEDLDDIYMRTQEMAVFAIKLSDAPEFESELLRKIDYAKEELVDTSSHMDFTINTNTADLDHSVLRVGFGKSGSGFTGFMNVYINDQMLGYKNLEYTNKSGDIMTVTEFDVDPSLLKDGENKVVISMQEGGKVTSIQLMNYYDAKVKESADASAIQTKIDEAMKLFDNNTYISADGAGLPAKATWITQTNYDSFVNVIKDASVILKDNFLMQDEVDEQVAALETAMKMYKKNKKAAVKGNSGVVAFPNTSFEKGEKVQYTLFKDNGASMKTVKVNNSNALKVTVPNMDTTWGKLSMVTWEAKAGQVWNLSNHNLEFDITNELDYDLPYVVNVTDAKGGLTMNWLSVPAKSTQHIVLKPAAPANYASVAKVSIWANEPNGALAGKTDVSFILDNVKAEFDPKTDVVKPAKAVKPTL